MNSEQVLAQPPLTDRGEKILKAAEYLFLEHGYKETSLEMIISESGGSRRNIYSEFGNKQGLLKAVLRAHIANQVEVLVDINYDFPPAEALENTGVRFLTGMLSDTLIALFRLVTNIVPELPEVGSMIYKYGPLTGSAPLSNYLKSLNSTGLFHIEDTDFAANTFIHMIKGQLHLKAILLPEEKISSAEIKAQVETVVPLFLKMYALK